MQWIWCGCGEAAARGRWEGGARSVWGHRLSFFFACWCMVPAFLRGRGRHLGGGSLRHAAARVVGRSCGASADDPGRHRGVVGGSGGRGSRAGCSVAVAGPSDEASIWRPSGSITTAESRPLTLARLAGIRGVAGAWMSASGLRRETARRLPRPRNSLLGGRPPPGIFSRWGHVTRPHNIID